MTAPAHPLRAAIQADRHDLAALRLLHGFLVALHESAPEARDELVALLTREPHGRGRA